MNVFRQLVVSISVQTAAERNDVSPSPLICTPQHYAHRKHHACGIFSTSSLSVVRPDPQIFHPFALPKMYGRALTLSWQPHNRLLPRAIMSSSLQASRCQEEGSEETSSVAHNRSGSSQDRGTVARLSLARVQFVECALNHGQTGRKPPGTRAGITNGWMGIIGEAWENLLVKSPCLNVDPAWVP